jgi:hypothetical protein
MAKELSESSDDRSEYWNLSVRGGTRKARGRTFDRGAICTGVFRACSVFLAGTVFLITIVLICLFMDIRQQLTILRAELDQGTCQNSLVKRINTLYICKKWSDALPTS